DPIHKAIQPKLGIKRLRRPEDINKSNDVMQFMQEKINSDTKRLLYQMVFINMARNRL
ncbi:8696_t:CDS:1, partial [Scutellospora calospora]